MTDIVKDAKQVGVLFLSYGSPSDKRALIPYMTSIRRGRTPTDCEVQNLVNRYEVIGQWTDQSLSTMAKRQCHVLQDLLPSVPTAIGYLHMQPSIEDAVADLVKCGVSHIIAIVTAPFYSALGTGAYEQRVDAAVSEYPHVTSEFIRHWWDQPAFIDYWMTAIQGYLQSHEFDKAETTVVFSAHSVPVVDAVSADGYADSLRAGAERIAQRLGLPHWSLAWQSAGSHGQWLGPTVQDAIEEAVQNGFRHIVFVPFGFVSNHVEVLYDNDIECRDFVEAGGARYGRVPMPDDDVRFIRAMADAITERIRL